MGFRGNNVLHRNHFRKDWQRRVKTWFDQPGQKKARRIQRQKKAKAAGIKPIDKLRPAVRCPTVRYNTKLKAGRGFTLEELKTAGIPKQFAKTIGISVDHRRRNRSEASLELNVERLNAYKKLMILLPRSKKHPKKGDSDVKDLENLKHAKTTLSVLPIPAGITHEAPRAITDEEKEFEAFAALRKARSDARHVGTRKIRAAKKAEEEANAKK